MLDDPKKEGLTTPDRRTSTKGGVDDTRHARTHAKGGVDDKWRGYNPSTHRYPLHSRRQAVTLSDCHALTIPHSRTRELRKTHKPENPTGKPDSKPPPEATSQTPDPRTGPQVGHKACIAPTIQTLTWGFLKEVRHTVRLVNSRPLRGVEAPSAQSRPPPQPSRGRPSAEQRPRGRRHGGINMHAIAAVQQIRDPRTPLLEILIPRSG